MARYARRVHFFHVTIHAEDGNLFQNNSENNDDDFAKTCKTIQGLNAANKTFKLDDNESYRMIYFQKHGDYYRGKVAKYRNNHMLTGKLSDDSLSDLALDEGNEFVEVTHFIYSPKKHVISFEYNQTGPRITAFIRYINVIRGKSEIDIDLFVAELIPHPSVIERLKEVRRISQFEIGISADRIPTTINQGNLLRGMSYLRGFANAGMITVQLSAGTLAKGESIISPNILLNTLENEGVDLGALGKASIKAVTDFGDETISLIDNKMVGVKEWNQPITTENFTRWFEDIAQMYTERTQLIQRSLRRNEEIAK